MNSKCNAKQSAVALSSIPRSSWPLSFSWERTPRVEYSGCLWRPLEQAIKCVKIYFSLQVNDTEHKKNPAVALATTVLCLCRNNREHNTMTNLCYEFIETKIHRNHDGIGDSLLYSLSSPFLASSPLSGYLSSFPPLT